MAARPTDIGLRKLAQDFTAIITPLAQTVDGMVNGLGDLHRRLCALEGRCHKPNCDQSTGHETPCGKTINAPSQTPNVKLVENS